MKVLVEAKNLVVTPALRKHVEAQATKLARMGKKILEVRVFLETIAKKSNDPHANKVTFSISMPGKDVVVRKQAVDMYEAIIDGAKAAVRKVRKEAERRITLARNASHKATSITS